MEVRLRTSHILKRELASSGRRSRDIYVPMLSVTVLSGLPGAGKKELLQCIKHSPKPGLPRCAFVTGPAFSAEGPDVAADEAEEDVFPLRDDEDLEDILKHISRLGKYGCVLVNNSRMEEPAQIIEDVLALTDVARLDTLVTVLDSASLQMQLLSTQKLKDHLASAGIEDTDVDENQRVCLVMMEHIELCDVIFLHGTERVPQDELALQVKLLESLNTGACILCVESGAVNPGDVIMTGLFDADRTPIQAGWRTCLDAADRTAKQVIKGSVPDDRTAKQVIKGSVPDDRTAKQVIKGSVPDDRTAKQVIKGSVPDDRTAKQVIKGSVPDDRTAKQVIKGSVPEKGDIVSPADLLGARISPQPLAKVQQEALPFTWVYRERRPFHPVRLHQLICNKHFELRQRSHHESSKTNNTLEDEVCYVYEEERTQPTSGSPIVDCSSAATGGGSTATGGTSTASGGDSSSWGQLLVRSQGYVWLAGPDRNDHCCDWSLAGRVLTLTTAGPWYIVLPREFWPSDTEKVEDIERDIMHPGPIGDRRQEMVFIGVDLDVVRIKEDLDACLCTEEEMERINSSIFTTTAGTGEAANDSPLTSSPATHQALVVVPQQATAVLLEDPFLPWPSVQDMIARVARLSGSDGDDEELSEEDDTFMSDGGLNFEQDGEEDGEEGGEEMDSADDVEETEDSIAAAIPKWLPGSVFEVTQGARELQQLLDDAPFSTPAVIDWHAKWAVACRSNVSQLRGLAAQYPGMMVLRVDVEATGANAALAREKVMNNPFSRRECNKSVLKSGHKWPCYTVHRAPLLQPFLHQLEDSSAISRLSAVFSRINMEDSPAAAWRGTCMAAAGSAAAATSSIILTTPQRAHQSIKFPDYQTSLEDHEYDYVSYQSRETRLPHGAACAVVASAGSHSWLSKDVVRGLVQHLKRGAVDLKKFLQESQSRHMPLAVAWVGGTADGGAAAAATSTYVSSKNASVTSTIRPGVGGGERKVVESVEASMTEVTADEWSQDINVVAELHTAVQDAASALRDATANSSSSAVLAAGPLLLIADVGASTGNRQLASALRVQQTPTLHVYQDMKVVKSFKGKNALPKLKAVMAELLQAAILVRQDSSVREQAPESSREASAPVAQSAETSAETATVGQAPVPASTSAAAAYSAVSTGRSRAAAPAPAAAAPLFSAVPGEPGIWDPPTGKDAKAGFEKMFPDGKGKGIFWPKMPCLRCGCAWWQGEDWDAQCIRCGWDCEFDGYDDDSRPLPRFKARFDAFTEILKAGRAPEWKGTNSRKTSTATTAFTSEDAHHQHLVHHHGGKGALVQVNKIRLNPAALTAAAKNKRTATSVGKSKEISVS
ncbi:hypothetical protein CEUSTIGMA_g11100.t1 [Chlamydomonas eustigma]|uniref:CobW C-terminal domain-containing protein n=1 Tax=Chlamydomonas eustigma TaxID=1157962 RepID=A0A250XKQ5_9CHLO|nr:hypothetical protein CEUSTIGMA_g11100.t1 [Chlamydomonas eustigma]|eukprot:GAX83675.1 hypothetical protein CEUSTIGMA_g11100.t1 [Chlamydomonas eustigma]